MLHFLNWDISTKKTLRLTVLYKIFVGCVRSLAMFTNEEKCAKKGVGLQEKGGNLFYKLNYCGGGVAFEDRRTTTFFAFQL